jgi:DNA-binding MarR family transcriptional regulator
MPHARDIHIEEYRALAELRYQIRRFLNFSEDQSRAAEIEPQQHQLLLVLKGLQSPQKPTIRTIAERLQIHHNSAVELVQRSAERGLVERGTSVDDRREAFLRVTPRGEQLLRRLSLAHRDELQSSAPALARALKALVGREPAKKRAKKAE